MDEDDIGQTNILKKLNISSRQFLSGAATVLVFYITFGATFYHIVEKWNWLDCFYFCVVTVATVGYGDFVPKTPAGKLFTMGYIFLGIGLFITVANVVLRNRGERRLNKMKYHQEKRLEKRRKKEDGEE